LTNRSSINYRFTTFNTDGFNTTTSNSLTIANSAPTATSLEITNPSDGVYILAGSERDYTLRMVGTDADGGSDISTIHGSLAFDDTHMLNISMSGGTVTFQEGGDYVREVENTVTTSGTNVTVDVVLVFSQTTPIVNNIDGYLKVTDSASNSSGWTAFNDIVSTMLYAEDGGGGGWVTPTEDEEEAIYPESESEPELLPAPEGLVIFTNNPELYSTEYLIESRNPLTNQYINAIPIPWQWTPAQKMIVIIGLPMTVIFLLSIIYKKREESKKRKRRKDAVFVNPILKAKY